MRVEQHAMHDADWLLFASAHSAQWQTMPVAKHGVARIAGRLVALERYRNAVVALM